MIKNIQYETPSQEPTYKCNIMKSENYRQVVNELYECRII